MAKINRATQKFFGTDALAGQIAQFGSAAAGGFSSGTTYSGATATPALVQALAAFETGWFDAVDGQYNPAIEDMNALFWLYAYQLCYLFQAGVAEWDDETVYYIGSIVNDGTGILYTSLTDDNENNAVSDNDNWVQYSPSMIDMFFGSGADGDLTASSGTTTLTRDTYYNDVTLTGTAKINTAGFKLFVNGVLDISAAGAGAIYNDGSAGGSGGNASGSTPGTAGAAGTALTGAGPFPSDWQSWTPRGTWFTNATYTGKFRQVGDSLECQVKIACAGAMDAVTLDINLPPGCVIDTNKMLNTTAVDDALGTGAADDGGSPYKVYVAYRSTTAVTVRYQSNASGISAAVTSSAPFTFGSSDSITVWFKVPCVNFDSGSVGQGAPSQAGFAPTSGNGGYANGASALSNSPANGGSGGASGAGGQSGAADPAGAAGSAGTATAFPVYRFSEDLQKGRNVIQGGCAGASGGTGSNTSDDAAGGSGAGGGGGGVLYIAARSIRRGGSTAASCITAKGGAGGNAGTSSGVGAVASGGSAGGGGGGGGWAYLLYQILLGDTATNCIDCSGGTGGNGANGGTGGSTSGDGGGGGSGGSGGRITKINVRTGTITETTGSAGSAGTAGGAHSGATPGTGGAGGAGNTFRADL